MHDVRLTAVSMQALGAPAALEAVEAAALRELTLLLQLAYSGERGAALAYLGHARTLRGAERAEVARIAREEAHHRRCLRRMLHGLGGAPSPRRERKLTRIGHAIAAFCRVGGWFFPMYGAGRLEAQNVREYELAARLAHQAGRADLVEPLLVMAEVEWDHERYFRAKAAAHPLWRVVPHWRAPPPREAVRSDFAAFLAVGPAPVQRVRVPLLVR